MIHLPAHVEKEIQKRISSGRYQSAEELISRAFHALDWLEMKEKVDEAIVQIEQGEFSEYTDETLHHFFDEIRNSRS